MGYSQASQDIDDAIDLAQTAIAATDAQINMLITELQDLTADAGDRNSYNFGYASISGLGIGDLQTAVDPGAPPAALGGLWETIAALSVPELTTELLPLSAIGDPTIVDFSHSAPSITAHTPPTEDAFAPPVNPGAPAQITLPIMPGIELPPVPSGFNLDIVITPPVDTTTEEGEGEGEGDEEAPTALTLPPLPSLATMDMLAESLQIAPTYFTVPTLADTVPVFYGQAPEPVLAYTPDAIPDRELFRRTGEWLEYQVKHGGTGLESAVESDIYDRARRRRVEASRRELDAALNEFSAAGYPLPPGALIAQRAHILHEHYNEEAELSWKITEDQAKLAQQNTHFAVEKALDFARFEYELWNKVQDRAFAYAQALANLAISVYDAKIRQYNVDLEAFKAEVSKFDAKLRGEVAQLEYYKSLLENAKIRSEIRKDDLDVYRLSMEAVKMQALLPVEIYNARVDAIRRLIETYVAQVNAQKGAAEIEALKIEQFKAQVDLYTAQLRTYETKANVYKTKTDAERNKVATFEAQVQAYKVQLDAIQARLAAQKAKVDSESAYNTAVIQQNEAELRAFVAKTQAMSAAAAAAATEKSAELRRYEVLVNQVVQERELMYKKAELQLEQAKYSVTLDNQRFIETSKAYAATLQAAIASTSAGVQALASKAAAIHTQVNLVRQAIGSDELSGSTP